MQKEPMRTLQQSVPVQECGRHFCNAIVFIKATCNNRDVFNEQDARERPQNAAVIVGHEGNRGQRKLLLALSQTEKCTPIWPFFCLAVPPQ
jgi:hypothetical protein